ncbi:MAG: methyl-accepting chemotaxis protein [Gemmatimonadaceae bacterium]
MLQDRSRISGGTLVVGLIGGALVCAGAWWGGRALLHLDEWVIAGIVATTLGAVLLTAAGLVSALAPPSDREAAQRLADTFGGVARGDLRRDPQDVQLSGPWFPVLQSAAHAIRFLRGALTSAQQFAKDTKDRADDLTGQVAAAHSVVQRTSELTAHAAQHAGTLREEARAASDDIQRLTSETQALAASVRREQDVAKRARLASQQMGADIAAAARSAKGLEEGHTATSGELERLTLAVDEVREFVALVRKMARQSKLLSLNAAMEAARAGEQGTGFGVVASEVRRLAKTSSEAVDRTEKVLSEMIARSAAARGNSREAAILARELQESLERAVLGMERQRAGEESGASVEGVEAVPARVAAAAANVERLALGIDAMADSVRDARHALSSQVSRAQELVTSAHVLSRAAAKSAHALGEFQLVPQAAVADEVRELKTTASFAPVALPM